MQPETNDAIPGDSYMEALQDALAHIDDLEAGLDSLRETWKLFQIMLDSIPVRVFWKDRDGVFVGCNRLFAEDVGLKATYLVRGKTAADMPWSAAEIAAVREQDEYILRTGESLKHIEQPLFASQGKEWMRLSKAPM
ncbi:MAG: PAS domain-containing protein, partial [Anaerolineae bacterium]|nr:PAS domain-containing protein [Anaerolineae bacterium]